MSKIEMSPAFAAAYAKRMLRYPAGDNTTTPANTSMMSGYNGSGGSGYLQIMKGAVPTDFSTLLNTSSRAADLLIKFTSGFYNGSIVVDNFGVSDTNVNPMILNTNHVAATNSGIAAWFWLYQTNTYNGTLLNQQLFGTIGGVGSGADLEIPDTNILATVPYRVTNLKLEFPTVWTF